MNRVNISIRTGNLPWRSWSCKANPSWVSKHGGWSATRSRRFASISRAGEERETFDIRCGSSGNITVDIYNSEALSNPLTPLVIYFPPTGVHLTQDHPPIPKFLSGLPFRTALAQIHYRWNIPPLPVNHSSGIGDITASAVPLSSAPGYNNHPFPTPLHDTLFAYDFLTTSFLPTFHPQSHKSSPQRPVILAGTFLGGTLATSLALTSTYTSLSRPNRVAALITQNAIFDWSPIAVSKADSVNELDEDQSGVRWTPQFLHGLKGKLFASPGSAFDTFASPLLFFRTSGWVVPKKWAGEPASALAEEVNRYSTSIDTTSFEEEEEVSWSYGYIPTSSVAKTDTPKEIIQEKDVETQQEEKPDPGPEIARISYLKFPPTTSPISSSSFSRYNNANPNSEMPQLKIPRALFLYSKPNSDGHSDVDLKEVGTKKKKKKSRTGEEEISSENQAKEMARVMRRSVLLVECKDRAMWDEGFDANGEAGSRVGILNDQGEGVDEKIRGWLEDSLE